MSIHLHLPQVEKTAREKKCERRRAPHLWPSSREGQKKECAPSDCCSRFARMHFSMRKWTAANGFFLLRGKQNSLHGQRSAMETSSVCDSEWNGRYFVIQSHPLSRKASIRAGNYAMEMPGVQCQSLIGVASVSHTVKHRRPPNNSNRNDVTREITPNLSDENPGESESVKQTMMQKVPTENENLCAQVLRIQSAHGEPVPIRMCNALN